MFEPVRGGTRGGQAEFKWADVSADKDRENYLGHSINAPTGRWQKNKDVHWYNRDKHLEQSEHDEEIRKLKELEADALAVALGFEPAKKPVVPAGSPVAPAMSPGGTSIVKQKTIEDAEAKAHAKEDKRKRKEARREEKRARKEARRERDRSRSRSPIPRIRNGERDRHDYMDDRYDDSDRSPRRGDGREQARDRSRSPRRLEAPRQRCRSFERPRGYEREREARGFGRTDEMHSGSAGKREEHDEGKRQRERERDRRRWDANNSRRDRPADSGRGRERYG